MSRGGLHFRPLYLQCAGNRFCPAAALFPERRQQILSRGRFICSCFISGASTGDFGRWALRLRRVGSGGRFIPGRFTSGASAADLLLAHRQRIYFRRIGNRFRPAGALFPAALFPARRQRISSGGRFISGRFISCASGSHLSSFEQKREPENEVENESRRERRILE